MAHVQLVVEVSGVELAVELLRWQSFNFRPGSSECDRRCRGEENSNKTVLSGVVWFDRFQVGKLHLFEEDPNDIGISSA